MAPELAMSIIMGIGIIFGTSAITLIATQGLRAISRNPEAAENIQTNLILSLAFAEAVVIYGLVVVLIIKFV